MSDLNKKFLILPHRKGNDYDKFLIKKYYIEINSTIYVLDNEVNFHDIGLYSMSIFFFMFQNEQSQIEYMGLGSNAYKYIFSRKEKLINPDLTKKRYQFLYEYNVVPSYDIGNKPFNLSKNLIQSKHYQNDVKEFHEFINNYTIKENIDSFITDVKTSFKNGRDEIFSHPEIKSLIRKEKIKKYII